MKNLTNSFFVILLFFAPFYSFSQIIGTSLGQTITIDFDSPTPGVCDGPIQGTGFTPNPAPGSGMLDSDAMSFSGLTNPIDMDFGGTATTGDAARGIAPEANNGSGFYAFEPSGGTGRAFGFQPSANHFNPGTVTIKFTNMTGEAINEFSVGLDIYFKNSSNRSTTYGIGVSTDGVNYTSQAGFSTGDFPGFLGSNWIGPDHFLLGDLLSVNQEVCVPEPILDGNSVFLRFEISDDGVGTDAGGDELAFDNIRFSIANRAYCAATDVNSASETSSPDNTTSTISWTNPTGCFDGIVVVASENIPVTANVSDTGMDGITLAQIDNATNVNSDWSTRGTDNEVFDITGGAAGTAAQDYIVYKGTGTSVDVTGLDPNLDYHFRVLAVSAGCDWAPGVDVGPMALATELLDFNAKQNGQAVVLNWQALYGENYSHISIEHSSNGQIFQELGAITNRATIGSLSAYEYTDIHPFRGENYYRLCMVEQDGRKNYSPILSLYFELDNILDIVVVPAEGRLQFKQEHNLDGQAYWIYNVVGEIQQTGIFSTTITQLQLSHGIYYLKIGDLPAFDFLWMP